MLNKIRRTGRAGEIDSIKFLTDESEPNKSSRLSYCLHVTSKLALWSFTFICGEFFMSLALDRQFLPRNGLLRQVTKEIQDNMNKCLVK